jgi:hypothetical protein
MTSTLTLQHNISKSYEDLKAFSEAAYTSSPPEVVQQALGQTTVLKLRY